MDETTLSFNCDQPDCTYVATSAGALRLHRFRVHNIVKMDPESVARREHLRQVKAEYRRRKAVEQANTPLEPAPETPEEAPEETRQEELVFPEIMVGYAICKVEDTLGKIAGDNNYDKKQFVRHIAHVFNVLQQVEA